MSSIVSPASADQDRGRTVEELTELLSRARAERDEALQQQAATTEVLQVVSSSPTETGPVFKAILERAVSLCSAAFGVIYRFDGELIHIVAHHNFTDDALAILRSQYPSRPGPATVSSRSLLERTVVQIDDASDASRSPDSSVVMARQLGYRGIISVPMLRNGMPIGTVTLAKHGRGPFTDKEVSLLRTFADQAVIAIENTRLFEAEQAKTREVEEASEIQAATAGILRVIASSPSDLTPVLSAVVETAARLCDASDALVLLRKGDELHTLAHHGPIPAHASGPIARDWVIGRAFLDRTPLQVADLAAAGADFPRGHAMAVSDGFRTSLAVPLMQRQGEAVGVICIRRIDVRPFTERQIALLQTFADQAVIAIENTRLFEAEQASKRELQESLEYQTAISEVLGVISRSPTDLQPVFDTIARSALHLCGGTFSSVLRFDGRLIHFVAAHGMTPEGFEALRRTYPPPGRAGATTRAIESCAVAEIPDISADPDFEHHHVAGPQNFRSLASVPMLKDGRPIGTITVGQAKTGRFPRRQIELLETFADQAVIAIENTRLFEEVQARTRELSESLEYQTATSEVLGVISRSPSELQPVLDAILRIAGRLCEAEHALFYMLEDGKFCVSAARSINTAAVKFATEHPISPAKETLVGRTAIERRPVHMSDCLADPDFTFLESQRVWNFRSLLGVPLLRDGEPIGVLSLMRMAVKPFTQGQIDLVTTFGNQALIAIENARLFEEVRARNSDLTALGEVGRAVSSTLDLRVVLKTVVERAVALSGTDAGSIFYYREDVGTFELGETSGFEEDVVARLRKLDIAARDTALGEAIAKRQTIQVPDVTKRPSTPLRNAVVDLNLNAALIIPLLRAESTFGALVLRRRQPGEFSESVVRLMESFADQSVIALENAHLFEEIAQKSRELEIASQHKSQFVANMSHELRTPLAAILGYAELMQEGFYGTPSEKSMDALTRIRSNGKHLLGLINTVLDIAKIESGQFSLNLGEYAIESVVETVRAATESLAETKKLSLKTDVGKRLPVGLGDEQRLTQVLLNLVGNAIKFTDTGEVRITATAMNSHFTVAVTDTGPGIPAGELNRVFDQFHQIDNSNTKAKGGTGLGLAIAKQIVEMHGGRIWVESTLGQGAIFQMQLPIRAEAKKAAAE